MKRRTGQLATTTCLLAALLLTALTPITGSAADSPARERQAKCVKLESRIAELRLKLRMGYTARQGRLYRQKLTTLEAEHRILCR